MENIGINMRKAIYILLVFGLLNLPSFVFSGSKELYIGAGYSSTQLTTNHATMRQNEKADVDGNSEGYEIYLGYQFFSNRRVSVPIEFTYIEYGEFAGSITNIVGGHIMNMSLLLMR